MAEKFSLKDHLFNQEKVTKLATEIRAVYPEFNTTEFISSTLNVFPSLELKQRISHIAEMLREYLPKEYPTALTIILNALPEKNDPTKTDNDYGDFMYAPYGEFVAKYGRDKDSVDISLNAIREITMRFSMEDAIRYFINDFPDVTYTYLLTWSSDPNYHVRRLASEGTRPKLPWSQKITVLTDSTLPILENLYRDKTRYVTRSVANHLNDLSKIDPELVITTLKTWGKSKKQSPQEILYISSHALRTLIKQGYTHAFELLGYTSDIPVTIHSLTVTDEVPMNTYLEFSFTVMSPIDTNIVIDYRIDFQNKKGEMNSKKIFKLKKLTIQKNHSVNIVKKHKMLEVMTTRRLYSGDHLLTIFINGKAAGSKKFTVVRN